MNKNMTKLRRRLIALFIGTMILAIAGIAQAQEATPDPEPTPEVTPAVVVDETTSTVDETTVVEEPIVEEIMVEAMADPITDLADGLAAANVSINTSWVFLTGFLVFFMQTGFAMLEAGLIRQTSVVNALLENFFDAGMTALIFWAVGFGIAFGVSSGGLFGTDNFFLSEAIKISTIDGATSIVFPMMGDVNPDMAWTGLGVLPFFFFQFAFAATASTIATGAMAERTDFVGDLIYTAIVGAVIYPVVVHWVWNSGGWLAKMGFWDFAGSTVVHTVGGVLGLVGAWMLGPRPNRKFGEFPPAHNLSLATLGTMILWFGWYGFNPGSTLLVGDGSLVGLVVLNTTLAAGAGALTSMFFVFFRTGRWDLTFTLNGSLAGLVAITAPCAFVMPTSAIIIGVVGGILVVLAVEFVEALKIDDPVGAFAVHGANGIWGTISIGLFTQAGLLPGGNAGLLVGGTADQLLIQLVGSGATIAWVAVTSFLMFGALKAVKRLRVDKVADAIGIDAYEHQVSAWPDVLPMQTITKE
jgi:Amt family ammonium transporter